MFEIKNMVNVGEIAPDFTLYDSDRKERKLSEFLYKDKKTILAFFPGAFTSVCTTELCTFRDMFNELSKADGVLVAISVDSPFSLKAFAEKYGFNFPLLSDFKREVIQKYGVLWKDLAGIKGYDVSNRAIFILDGNGKVIYRWIADNPGQLPDFELVKKVLQQN
jgi:peroxiredoxin